MAAWVLYVTLVGACAGVAALLGEQGLRRLRLPVRWAWFGATAATVVLPAVLAVAGSDAARGAPVGLWPPAAVEGRLPDLLLVLGWAITSVVLLANVRLSAWTLRRNERSWRSGRMGGQRLLVTETFGPGVIGARQPRIVLPQWVLDAAPSLRRLVLLHEVEHVRARDTRLLLCALVLVALVPWCLPLWWHLHRLRAAIEEDCDARVVAAGADPRDYATALVEVAGRPPRDRLPVPALAPRRGELERRIRYITASRRRSSRPVALALLLAATAVAASVAAFPSPGLPSLPRAAEAPAAPDEYGAAAVFFSVEGR